MFDPIYIHDKNFVTPLGATRYSAAEPFVIDWLSHWPELLMGKNSIFMNDVGRDTLIHASKFDVDETQYLLPLAEGSSLLEQLLFNAAKPVVDKHVPTARTALVLATTKGNVSFLKTCIA